MRTHTVQRYNAIIRSINFDKVKLVWFVEITCGQFTEAFSFAKQNDKIDE